MPKQSETETLKRLKAQQDKLKAKIAREKRKINSRERDDRNREMIIVGAAVTAHAEKHPDFARMLEAALRAGVTREVDKEFLAKRGRINAAANTQNFTNVAAE